MQRNANFLANMLYSKYNLVYFILRYKLSLNKIRIANLSVTEFVKVITFDLSF